MTRRRPHAHRICDINFPNAEKVSNDPRATIALHMATVELMDVAAVTPPDQVWKLGQHIKLLSPAVRVSSVAPFGGRIVSVAHANSVCSQTKQSHP